MEYGEGFGMGWEPEVVGVLKKSWGDDLAVIPVGKKMNLLLSRKFRGR
jgi:hypothetical protein